MYDVVVDFVPLIVALVSVFFLSRQIWLYLLKDVIVEKISEAQSTKKRARGLASSGLLEYREKISGCGLELVTASDIDEAKDLFSDIHDASVHSSNALATVTHLSKYVFSNVFIEDIETWDDSDGETGGFVLGMRRQDFYAKVISSLSLIESKSVRSIEMPEGISVSSASFLPYKVKGYFSGQGVKYIKGMGQGAKLSPLDANVGEFFIHAVGLVASEDNVIFAKRFFQILGGNNSVFIPYFLEDKIYAPMRIEFPSNAAFKREVCLVSIQHKVSLFDGNKKSVSFVYSNLSLNMSFFNGIDEETVLGRFEDIVGVKPHRIRFYHRHECFEVAYSKEDLEFLYRENFHKVAYGYWVNSVESSLFFRLNLLVVAFFSMWWRRLLCRLNAFRG